jgi:hypothetical protein
MCNTKVFIIVILLLIITQTSNRNEGFMSSHQIKMKTTDLYNNRDVFQPGVNYGKVKKRMSWIDPVIYDDVYKESLKNKLSYSNLEKIFK